MSASFLSTPTCQASAGGARFAGRMELPPAGPKDGGTAQPRRDGHPWYDGQQEKAAFWLVFPCSTAATSIADALTLPSGADLQRRIVQHAPEVLQQLRVSADDSAEWRLYK